MEKLSVFLSYSLTKTHNVNLTSRVIKIVKERIQARFERDMEIIDAMEPAIGWIREKVEAALRDADALIAEASTWSPNVMYELGFAQSNKCPIILLVDRKTREGDHSPIFHNLSGSSSSHSAPADLGDIEYIEYTDEVDMPGEHAEFVEKIDKSLTLLNRKLPPGIRSLRRGERRLQQKTDELGKSCIQSEDPPMLRLLSGWLEKSVVELGGASSNGFFVHPKYYQSCFAKFKDTERHNALAIADLSDETEPTSLFADTNIDMTISERIFLVSGHQFLRAEALGDILTKIRAHHQHSTSSRYRILIARSDNSDISQKHPFTGARSQDLLLISPDLVGGYEEVDKQSYLKFIASHDVYNEAQIYYDAIRARAFHFDPYWNECTDMKAAWLRQESKIGFWKGSWTPDDRDRDYYDLYEFHIRTWIPGYEELLDTTAVRVLAALFRMPPNSVMQEGSVRMLEIGQGTGNLTRRVLGAVQRSPTANRIFDRLFAVDKSPQMIKTTNLVADKMPMSERVHLTRGVAFSNFDNSVTTAAPYGVIYGSLVLSHLLQNKVERLLDETLESARKLLVPGGSLVLSDALVLEPTERPVLEENWRRSMINNGLHPDRARAFLENNQAMLCTATREQLEASARRQGMELLIEAIPGFVDLPFATITLQRSSDL